MNRTPAIMGEDHKNKQKPERDRGNHEEIGRVWNAATRPEKTELRHEVAKKRVSYLERANTQMSREERQTHPVYGPIKALKLAQDHPRATETLGETQ
jgi:hypothetical protein